MKKNNLLFTTLLFALTAMPANLFAMEVSGTVSDDMDVLIGANIVPLDSDGQPIKNQGAITNTEGRFNANFPAETKKLRISYTGYETQIETPGQNLNITLVEGAKTLKEVETVATHQDGDPCSGKPLKDPYAAGGKGQWKKINNTWVCVPTECKIGYELKDNACKEIICDVNEGFEFNGNANKCDKTQCSESEKQKISNNKGTNPVWNEEKKQCVPTGCESGYHLQKNKCIHDNCSVPEEDWIDGKCVKVKCTDDEKQAVHAKEAKWENDKCVATECDEKVYTLKDDGICDLIDKRSGDEKRTALEEKEKAYKEAKEKEQSLENRTLTALSTAATGIGGMELMQGMAEQSADKDAEADMTAYIETMRCTYGEGKQVKAGIEEIELPGANDQELMNLRAEYLALAADLKERKEVLGMKPGIESEEILDRANSGLYDDETIGITKGSYESLYRAQMLNSEADQQKIDDQKSASKTRVIAGGVAAGVGAVGSIVGNQLINGKLGEKLKQKKADKNMGKEEKAFWENEDKALENLKKCLKDTGVKETDSLDFANFYPSVLSVKNINCKNQIIIKNGDGTTLKPGQKPNNLKASDIFVDSSNADEVWEALVKYFDVEKLSKMIGYSINETKPYVGEVENMKTKLKESLESVQKKLDEAKKKDKKTNSNKSEKSNGLGDLLGNVDISSVTSNLLGN